MAGFREAEIEMEDWRTRNERDRAMHSLGMDGYDIHLSRAPEIVPPTSNSRKSKVMSSIAYVAVNVVVLWGIGKGLPDSPSKLEQASPTVVASLAAFACYLAVQWSNPGFVNEGDAREHEPPPLSTEFERRRDGAAAAAAAARARTRDTFSALLPWPEWPPMRAAYCRVSKRWVYTYDHFCPIVSTPIGERNRGRFWLFLLAQVVALGHVAVLSEDTVRWADVFDGVEAPLVSMLIIYIVFFAVVVFFLFHSFLALSNMTTHEFLRADTLDYLHNTEDFDLPFSRGPCGNLAEFFGQDGLITALRCKVWKPINWARPIFIERRSSNFCLHPWQNKYWSCC